jgi:hypothetical protein
MAQRAAPQIVQSNPDDAVRIELSLDYQAVVDGVVQSSYRLCITQQLSAGTARKLCLYHG